MLTLLTFKEGIEWINEDFNECFIHHYPKYTLMLSGNKWEYVKDCIYTGFYYFCIPIAYLGLILFSFIPLMLDILGIPIEIIILIIILVKKAKGEI